MIMETDSSIPARVWEYWIAFYSFLNANALKSKKFDLLKSY